MLRDKMMETRLTEIEIKLTQMEDLLETLNLTVFRQQEQIASLQQHIRLLSQQVQDMTPPERGAPNEETPPHYRSAARKLASPISLLLP